MFSLSFLLFITATLEEDQAFAEYLIIGTFLSMLLTLGVFSLVTWSQD